MDIIIFILLFYHVFSFIIVFTFDVCVMLNKNSSIKLFITDFIIVVISAWILLPILIGIKLYEISKFYE